MRKEKLQKRNQHNKIIQRYENVIGLIEDGSCGVLIVLKSMELGKIENQLCLTVEEELKILEVLNHSLKTLKKELLVL